MISKSNQPKINIATSIGTQLFAFFSYLGRVVLLGQAALKALWQERSNGRDILKQAFELGVRTVPLSSLIGFFTGLVLALQLIVGLSRFGLSTYSGQVVGIAITRELGPVLTAIMVAARVGSGIASELGSMTVSEQILAIRAMGASPIHKLVLPRLIVTTLATPLLAIMAIFMGILGGMLMSTIELGLSPYYYLEQIKGTVEIYDLTSGLAKTVFFGLALGLIACDQGLNTSGGTEGVGRATTQSVVFGSMAIFVLDFFLTKLFLMF